MKPYTDIGVRRLRCFRCGEKAHRQWKICADGSQYRPICLPCDIALNNMVLKFMGDPKRDEKMRAYESAQASY